MAISVRLVAELAPKRALGLKPPIETDTIVEMTWQFMMHNPDGSLTTYVGDIKNWLAKLEPVP